MEEFNLRKYFFFARKNLITLIVAFFLVFIFAVYAYSTAPRIHQIKSLLQVQTGANSVMGYEDLLERSGTSLNISEQIELYKSRENKIEAINDLSLNVVIDNETLQSVKNKPFVVETLKTNFTDGLNKTFKVFVIFKKNSFDLFDEKSNLIIQDNSFENAVDIDGFYFNLRKKNETEIGKKYLLSILPDRYSIRLLKSFRAQKAYDSRSFIDRNNLIISTIAVEDISLGKDILNKMNSLFTKESIESKAEEARKSLNFIENRIDEIRNALQKSEDDLNEFKKLNVKFDLDLEAQANLEQISLLDEKITELEIMALGEELGLNTSNFAKNQIQNQIKLLNEQKNELEIRFSGLPEKQQEFLNLARDAELNRSIYTELLEKKLEFSIVEASTLGNVRVIDSAYYDTLVSPLLIRTFATYFAFGVLLLILYVVFMTTYFRRIELPTEIDEEYDDLQRMGVLLNEHEEGYEDSLESFGINAALNLEGKKVISIIGATKAVGKSFISNNLAKYFAESGKKVLLVDADFRRGDLHKTYNKKKNHSSFYEKFDTSDFENLKVQKNLYLVPRVSGSSVSASNILGSETFKKFINDASKTFDYVILDTPPILSLSHALILISLSDDYLFVARHRVTKFNEIEQTRNELKLTEFNNVKYVYNDFVKPTGLYYGHDYYAYKYFRNYKYYSYEKHDSET